MTNINAEEGTFQAQYKELEKRITKLEQQIKDKSFIAKQHRSDDLKDLFAALAKSQAEMPIANANSENSYFKTPFSDIEEIVNSSRPYLAKNQLSVMQNIIDYDDGSSRLHTILGHGPSGQWIESTMRIVPVKGDVQSLGSYLTAIKRYAYAALVGVVARHEDDDGEFDVATTRETFAKGTAINHKFTPKNESFDVITKEQLEMLEDELKDHADLAEEVLDKLKIQNLADMRKSSFSNSIAQIRKIKTLREGK